MNKRKLWTLCATPGLAVTGLLLALLLLSQGKVGAVRDESAVIADTASSSPGFAVSGEAIVTHDVEQVGESYLCSRIWITETVDSAGDVGNHTALALEPTYPYTPHTSYHYIASDSLKYAWLSGSTWLSETVDLHGGQWTSLALAPTYPYTPCISYHDYNWSWELRYACLKSTTWITMRVGGLRAGQDGTSLALEPNYPYTPHISYRYPAGGSQHLGHAYLSGAVWYSGTWVHDQVEYGPPVGAWNSLALEPTYPYTPHISYYANEDLKHAWLGSAAWLSETVDSAGDVGWNTSLALDNSGNPHISYVDNTNHSLKYTWLSGATWLSETVASIGKDAGWGTRVTSLELNQAGVPYISYYDAANGDLKLAYLSGAAWAIQTVDSVGDVGRFNSLALDQAGRPHISYYDATNGNLKYAYLLVDCVVYLPSIVKDYIQP